MLLAILSLTLAFASDRPAATQEPEPISLEDLSRLAIKACRKADSLNDMASGTDPLREQAGQLSEVVTRLAHEQLPALTLALRQSPGPNPTRQTESLNVINGFAHDLDRAGRFLDISIRTSEQTGALLTQTGDRSTHGQARRELVRLCAGDRVQLFSAMTSVGELFTAQEPVINQLLAELLLSSLRQPKT